MRSFFNTFASGVLALAFALALNSCQNSSGPSNTPVGTGLQKGSLAGKVVTTGNAALSGVQVVVGNQVAYTNSKGDFYFTNVPAGNRVIIDFLMNGYASGHKVAEVRGGRMSYVDAALLRIGVQQNLNAANGGTVNFSGASVQFPANALVNSAGNPFTGTAVVQATWFDPTGAQFYGAFPGEFSGVRQDNSETAIESFGFISVDIMNGTEKLQLAANQLATINVPIPAALQAKAPQTIPLWYYDESRGQWIEDGSATKTGTKYVGTVKHFSNWNCDMPNQTSYLEGVVVDQNNNPVSFAAVRQTGVDYTGQATVHTNDDGTFKIAVKSSATAKVWASYSIIQSTSQNISTPPTGQTLNIGTIVLPIDTLNLCTIIGRVIDNGQNPVANQRVEIQDMNGKTLDYLYSSKDGKFKFFGELGLQYKLKIGYSQDSTTTKTITITCPTNAGTLDLGDITLDIGGSTIIGRVVDANSNPLRNVYISGIGIGSDPNGGSRETSPTDSLGRFTLWVRPNLTFNATLYYNQQSKTVSFTSGNLGDTKDVGDIVFP